MRQRRRHFQDHLFCLAHHPSPEIFMLPTQDHCPSLYSGRMRGAIRASKGVSQEIGELEKVSPFVMPTVTEQSTAQSQHGLSAGSAPTHTGLFHALLDNDLASRLDGAAANRI